MRVVLTFLSLSRNLVLWYFQHRPVRRGNQHGGHKYDDLQNKIGLIWLRMKTFYRGFSRDVTAAKSCKSRYSQPPCWMFFALSGIGKSHKICAHSLLLNLHKAKLHRSNNIINIYSLTTSLTCSNKISKKLKHILLFFPSFSFTAPCKKISNMASAQSAHGVRTASWKPSIVEWKFGKLLARKCWGLEGNFGIWRKLYLNIHKNT